MRRNTIHAILLMTASSFAFAVMGVCVKASTREAPFLVAVFFRSFVGMAPLVAWFLLRRKSFSARQHGLLFVRSLFGFTAMCMYFLAIDALPLATAVVLNFSSPVFVVLLSGLLLKERTAVAVLPLVAIAFGGVGLLVAPDFSDSGIEATLGLASALFAALAYITIKRLSRTESPTTIVLYFSAYSTVLSAAAAVVAAVFGWVDVRDGGIAAALLDPRQMGLLFGVGVAGTLGQVLLTSAYSRERASVVSPFQYLSPLFSYGFGLALFDERLTAASLAGGAVVIAASIGVVIVSREPPAHVAGTEPLE